MKIEDYEKLVQSVVAGGDDKEAKATDLLEALRADDAKRTEDAQKMQQQEDRIRTLTETNSRLFLSVSGGNNSDGSGSEGTSTNPRDTFNDLFDKRFYGGNE